MADALSTAKWIWYTEPATEDSYGDFKDSFIWEGGKAICRISADGDYSLFVNGKHAASNQYGDFEHYKIYDSIDISSFLKKGENEIFILVWHLGIGTSRYRPGAAGLIYELLCGDDILCCSSEKTLCRPDPHYASGLCRMITPQLGQSFLYDASAEDDIPFGCSVAVSKNCQLFPRPILKARLLPKPEMKLLSSGSVHFLIDLGEETVGLPTLSFSSPVKQEITVTWGEHIADGGVRRRIGARDFSFSYIAKAGENDYTNYMLRLGCRYLEIFCQAPIDLHYAGLIPQFYPTERVERDFTDASDRKIYELCVRTLENCMMEEHYVDTPWREQCFYSYDSRNQMLCGYRAFKNGNRDYARAALLLISKDDREDGLLSITYPSGGVLAIPSFSLHYFRAVREYLEFTGDLSLGEEVFGKLSSLLKVFEKQLKDGLLCSFSDSCYWNFYDWSEYNEESVGVTESRPDLMINVLYILALEDYAAICRILGKEEPDNKLCGNLRRNTRNKFFVPQDGLFTMREGTRQYSELGNSLAVLAGLTDEKESLAIAEKMLRGETAECSLSMKCFKYDALLRADESYITAVRDEIRRTYLFMADSGATSVWEVIEGESAFDNAGSLCHGWSSVPILYL